MWFTIRVVDFAVYFSSVTATAAAMYVSYIRGDLRVYGSILATACAVVRFEDRIPFLESSWFVHHWATCFPLVATYLATIYFGQKHLKSKVECGNLLRYWNFSMAIFSIIGGYRVGSEFLRIIITTGFYPTICDNSYVHFKPETRIIRFWYAMFVQSKVLEFLDTMFLVLNQKPIRFIHWFHHSLTLIYSFYISSQLPSVARWFCVLNYFVHSFMYSYYFITSFGVRLPRLALTITTMQTVQMFLGFGALFAAYSFREHGCINPGLVVEAGLAMYSFYIILFVNLLYKSIGRNNIANKTN